MHIESISYKNLRNLKDNKIVFGKGINIFIGDNAQGKTNLLESIYFCGTGRSHRTHYYKDLIKFQKDETYIQISTTNDYLKDRIDVYLKKNKKGIAINNITIKKLGELFGILLVVIFSPEDLNLIKSGPEKRRRFVDMELCQLKPLYYHGLGQYYNVLRQRNNLLKKIKVNKNLIDTIFVWDKQLETYGTNIIEYRKDFIKKINAISHNIHSNITNKKEKLEIIYKPNVNPEEFLNKLQKNIERDVLQGSTSVGIHKDDLLFLIDGVDTKTYGSQGQQRTASLSTKLAQIELIFEEKNTYPILLLDDVLSELDENRQKFILKQIKDIQTIITCTGTEKIIDMLENSLDTKIYHVKEGDFFDAKHV